MWCAKLKGIISTVNEEIRISKKRTVCLGGVWLTQVVRMQSREVEVRIVMQKLLLCERKASVRSRVGCVLLLRFI